MKQENSPLVNIDNLKVYFGSRETPVRAVDGVSLELAAGEFVAFVGESGCGKSMLASAVTGLLPPSARQEGRIDVKGRDVSRMNGRELRTLRGGTVAYIFQEPGRSLNPVLTAGEQIAEAVRLHRRNLDVKQEVLRQMKRVGLPDPEKRYGAYPHQLSGGMQQRVMIAMALACQPELLIADEPTTALDVTIQAQIIELLYELNQQLGMAVWLITHNLGLARGVAERACVMYAGRIVEQGETDVLLSEPAHPYTRLLLASVPALEGKDKRLTTIPGRIPSPADWPVGCRFHPRCDIAQAVCNEEDPTFVNLKHKHQVACLLAKG
jgi:peptide/nickel transport system ATP-binding protein